MYHLYKVDAVHDIFKRVIKFNLTPDEMTSLLTELTDNGYEVDNIDCKVTNTVYEAGDKIEITKEMFDALPTTEYIEANWKEVSAEERYQNDARKTIGYVYGKNPVFPITGTIEHIRISHNRGQMVCNWDGEPKADCWKQTNCYILEYLGFHIPEPDIEPIPILKADDSLLNTHEKVLKYLMIQNDWTKEKAINYLKPLEVAMQEAEAVFYNP